MISFSPHDNPIKYVLLEFHYREETETQESRVIGQVHRLIGGVFLIQATDHCPEDPSTRRYLKMLRSSSSHDPSPALAESRPQMPMGLQSCVAGPSCGPKWGQDHQVLHLNKRRLKAGEPGF